MSLVFTCITAHTPLLMPTVSKENLALLEQTKKAMEKLEQDLYLAQPETVLIISPHGDILPDAITLNANPEYVTNFEEFGDLVTKQRWKSDFMLIDRIREDFKIKHLPLALMSSEALDYGMSVPLCYLTAHLPQIKIAPLLTSQLDLKTHYELGRQLKDELMSSTKRIAVIASADLSHRVGPQSPAGYSPRGEELDAKIRELVEKDQLRGLLDIDAAWSDEAKACGMNVLAVLAGIMDDVKHQTEIISYEKPFGVGYLVAGMRIT
ncbi:MAG: AmmeMemoRadiSam system protein B [Patescibacteria group bacterium]|jgi:AmmeMemoRadiSam system protein B